MTLETLQSVILSGSCVSSESYASDCLLNLPTFCQLKTFNNSFTKISLSKLLMVSFGTRGMVNTIIILLLAQFPQKRYLLHISFLLAFCLLELILDMLTSCFSFLTDVARSMIDLPNSFDDRSFVPTCKIKRSALLLSDGFTSSFMSVVYEPEKVLTKTLQFVFTFLDILHPLRSFILLFPMTNIDFPSFSPFGLSFSTVIDFGGLPELSNDLAIIILLLAFLDIYSSCFSS